MDNKLTPEDPAVSGEVDESRLDPQTIEKLLFRFIESLQKEESDRS